MSGYGRILIVDDDPAFLETYEDLLSAEGYVVETAKSHSDALRRLDEPGWSVVLVDQKLQGPGGPDIGLDLIIEARRRAPGAKAMLVTAYASRDAVERAFRDGAYDYLEKTPVFEALLRVKVRNAMEAVRERWLATLDLDETERAIVETWAVAQVERDGNRKGLLLERLVALLLKSVPGFDRLDMRLRNRVEELDVLVQNSSPDPFWQKESPYILVECKHWSKPVGAKELRDLWGKMEGRYDRCRLALLIAPGGFADTVRALQLRKAEKETLVILIGAGDLDELIRRQDRGEALKEMHRRAVAAAFERKDDESSRDDGAS
jgi:CheY-like chemotaxis protein